MNIKMDDDVTAKMSSRPKRSAARHALEAIHQYYGVKDVQSQKVQPQKKETDTRVEKHAFIDTILTKIKESEKAPTQEERRQSYVRLFEYIVENKKLLAYYPSMRTTLTEKMREFDETIRKQVIQFPMSSIYNHICSLRDITTSISHVSKDMEKNYQDKLGELKEIVGKYYVMLQAVDMRMAMERLKRAIAEANQST